MNKSAIMFFKNVNLGLLSQRCRGAGDRKRPRPESFRDGAASHAENVCIGVGYPWHRDAARVNGSMGAEERGTRMEWVVSLLGYGVIGYLFIFPLVCAAILLAVWLYNLFH